VLKHSFFPPRTSALTPALFLLALITIGGILPLCLPLCSVASETPRWFYQGRPTAQADQAVAILAGAADEGLSPANYNATTLGLAVAAAGTGAPLDGTAATSLGDALTAAMHSYLSDLHFGRVDPRAIRENFSTAAAGDFDPAVVLEQAVRGHRLAEAVAAAAPPLPLYRELRRALAHYRKIAADTAQTPLWSVPLPPLPDKTLEPGQVYSGLPMLAQRLVALGDLPEDTFISDSYSGEIAAGVQSFQERHGLAPDGVIGRRTLADLNVSPAARVRQIELTMERLRWTPLLDAPRVVVVNVPDNILEAYEVHDGQLEEKLRMRVITGNAPDKQTPIFDREMRSIEFNPYWNVPSSIARKELVPELRKYPHLFNRQGFEFVSPDGTVDPELSFAALDAVLRGEKRIRQRPGPKNAMGDIKFIMPNKDNIYLHHTSAPRLFERFRRDLSHGCVRVEDPVALAGFVLRNDPAWSEERIRETMETGTSTTIALRDPVRVVIAYKTVLVRNDEVFFFSDIYGQDRLLDRALRGEVQRLD